MHYNEGWANGHHYNIQYFDKKELETGALIDEAYATVANQIKDNENFEVSRNGNEFKVTILNQNMDSIQSLAGTGIATAAKNLLETAGVKSVTLKFGDAVLEVSKDTLDKTSDEFLAQVMNFFKAVAGDENATAKDLIGKTITATSVSGNK